MLDYAFVNLFCIAVLTAYLCVLVAKVLVQTVERVYLEDIAPDDGAACRQLFLQACYLAYVAALYLLELFQQLLCAKLFLCSKCPRPRRSAA